jgi:GTP-binding protein EngB required for normal cell division
MFEPYLILSFATLNKLNNILKLIINSEIEMSLSNDYFLLYQGIPHPSKEVLEIDEQIDDETFFEVSALMLSVTRKSFEKCTSLESFHEVAQLLTRHKISDMEVLYHLQSSIIEHFIQTRCKDNMKHLHVAFDYLKDESILESAFHAKLLSLFDPELFRAEEHEILPHSISENFHSDKQMIVSAIGELKTLFLQNDSLDTIIDYLNNQTFSIGITGVMNAGKSTMLNALMGKEILGTSVVPETANLTIVKYSHTPTAKVIYWNENEWKRIEESAHSIDAMRTFVDETHQYYADNLNDFIGTPSKEEAIEVDNLSAFTSAKSSDKRCNLVKYVELGSELHFLHDGIEIVDTPGLDDIVIQREEITKEYIAKCDLMLHLMNVSQSATEKDIEFIIDALLYQNVSKILIVITRADMVSKKEVSEVIEYTKRSIAARLNTENSDSKLDFILKNLHFIAISSQMALLHKTGRAKEALDAGYTLEDSGILEVESYLDKTLFGKNSERSALIIHSARTRLAKAIEQSLTSLGYELRLLSKSTDELNIELAQLQKVKVEQMLRFNSLKEQISAYESELENFLESEEKFLENELQKLQSIIKKRLIDEINYTLEKEKKAPHPARVKVIVETAIKHGLVDIIRDYRYKFVQKATKISEAIRLQYSDVSFSMNNEFEEAFKSGFLTSNNEVLITHLTQVVSGANRSNLLKIDDELLGVIKVEFSSLETMVKSKAITISQSLLVSFFTELKAPIHAYEKKFSEDEAMIERHLNSIEDDESMRNTQSLEIRKRIKSIELIEKRCSL